MRLRKGKSRKKCKYEKSRSVYCPRAQLADQQDIGYIRKAIAKGISKEYKKQIMSEAIGMEEKKDNKS